MKFINLNLIKNKRKIIGFSSFLILFSLVGILYSSFYTNYKRPINLGIDFIGGNEIIINRICEKECSVISPDSVIKNLQKNSSNKNLMKNIRLQYQNDFELISIRTPYLTIQESNTLINDLDEIIGPLN